MSEARFDRIHESVTHLRQHATRLRDAVKAPYFKKRLSDAIFDLDEIDSFVLPGAEKASGQSSEAMWLDAAELRLQMAGSTIGTVQAALDTYGNDAAVVSGE